LIMAGGKDIRPGMGSPCCGESGKGRPFTAVFGTAGRLKAKACVLQAP
jgi:hypothetical protein